MPVDPGVFLRLKSAIDATVSGIGEPAVSVKALADAYTAFRAEAERLAHDNQLDDEFERLFPAPQETASPSTRAGVDPFALASQGNEALSLLNRLSGWLDGFVQTARVSAEAQAYAEARLRQESTTS